MNINHTGYYQEVVLPFKLPTPMYGAMLAIWQMRDSLQKRFPLHLYRKKDYIRYLAWCVTHGRRDYKILRQIENWNKALSRPAKLPSMFGDKYGSYFTVGMYLAGIARYQYCAWPVILTRRARRNIWKWYFDTGIEQLDLPLSEWQYNIGVEKKIGNIPVSTQNYLSSRKAIYVDENNEDFVSYQFDNKWLNFIVELYLRFHSVHVCKYYRISLNYWIDKLFASKYQPTEEQKEKLLSAIIINKDYSDYGYKKYPFGVNLFGYAHGELGIGEDVRMVALTLDEAGVPFCVINLKAGADVSQKDTTISKWVSTEPVYGVNIFCVTAVEHLRAFLTLDASYFDNRYTIGMWPWELPVWPRQWRHIYTIVDEIWGISSYTTESYMEFDKSKRTMPLPVSLHSISARDRKSFGLPEESYLFIYSFDMLSTLNRKNPKAVIDAFELAFPRHTRQGGQVGLVIKVNHISSKPQEWHEILDRIDNDEDVFIIDETLRKEDVLALYKACDCFVSLHRAEGFGRSIMESLMLGLDVVATGFSGNVDFHEFSRNHLVKFTKVPLSQSDYFLSNGQYWAEPDISHAADVMRQLFQDSSGGEKEELGAELLAYHPMSVHDTYSQHLKSIYSS